MELSLHAAAMAGDTATVRSLLAEGASLNGVDHLHFTPAHAAAHSGSDAVLRLLIGSGADLSLCTRQHDTAVHLAAIGGHPNALEALLERLHLEHDHSKKSKALCTPNHAGLDPLMLCVLSPCGTKRERGARLACVRQLLAAGAQPAPPTRGWNALLLASSRGDAVLVESMLDAAADTERALCAATEEGDTALLLGAFAGSPSTVRILLHAGADPLATNAKGLGAIDMCIAGATNGATTNGATTNGATTNGAATDGAATDGAATDSATRSAGGGERESRGGARGASEMAGGCGAPLIESAADQTACAFETVLAMLLGASAPLVCRDSAGALANAFAALAAATHVPLRHLVRLAALLRRDAGPRYQRERAIAAQTADGATGGRGGVGGARGGPTCSRSPLSATLLAPTPAPRLALLLRAPIEREPPQRLLVEEAGAFFFWLGEEAGVLTQKPFCPMCRTRPMFGPFVTRAPMFGPICHTRPHVWTI